MEIFEILETKLWLLNLKITQGLKCKSLTADDDEIISHPSSMFNIHQSEHSIMLLNNIFFFSSPIKLARHNFQSLQNSILLLLYHFYCHSLLLKSSLCTVFSNYYNKRPFQVIWNDAIFFLQQAALTETNSDTKHCLQLLWKYIYLYPVVMEAKDQGT